MKYLETQRLVSLQNSSNKIE